MGSADAWPDSPGPGASVSRGHWMPNGAVRSCTNPSCNREFSRKERKHHCRCCGNVYCSECSQCILPLNAHTAMIEEGGEPSKACVLCFQRAVEEGYPLGRFLNSETSSSFGDSDADADDGNDDDPAAADADGDESDDCYNDRNDIDNNDESIGVYNRSGGHDATQGGRYMQEQPDRSYSSRNSRNSSNYGSGSSSRYGTCNSGAYSSSSNHSGGYNGNHSGGYSSLGVVEGTQARSPGPASPSEVIYSKSRTLDASDKAAVRRRSSLLSVSSSRVGGSDSERNSSGYSGGYSSADPASPVFNKCRTLDASDKAAARRRSSTRPISLLSVSSGSRSGVSNSGRFSSSSGEGVSSSGNGAVRGDISGTSSKETGGGRRNSSTIEFGNSRTLDSRDKAAIRQSNRSGSSSVSACAGSYGAGVAAAAAAAAGAGAGAVGAAAADDAEAQRSLSSGSNARRRINSAYRHLSMDLTNQFGDLSSLLIEPLDPNHVSLLQSRETIPSRDSSPAAFEPAQNHVSLLQSRDVNPSRDSSPMGSGPPPPACAARSGLGLPPRKDSKPRQHAQQQHGQQQQQGVQTHHHQQHQQQQHSQQRQQDHQLNSQQRPPQPSAAAAATSAASLQNPLLAPGSSPLTPSSHRPPPLTPSSLRLPPPLTPTAVLTSHRRSSSSISISTSSSISISGMTLISISPLRPSLARAEAGEEAARAQDETDAAAAAEMAAAEAAAAEAAAAAATAAAAARREALYRELAAPSALVSPPSEYTKRAAVGGSVNLDELLASWEKGVSFLDPDVSLRTPRNRNSARSPIASPKSLCEKTRSKQEGRDEQGCESPSKGPNMGTTKFSSDSSCVAAASPAKAGGSATPSLKPSLLQRAAEAEVLRNRSRGTGAETGEIVESNSSSRWARRKPNLRVKCGSSGNCAPAASDDVAAAASDDVAAAASSCAAASGAAAHCSAAAVNAAAVTATGAGISANASGALLNAAAPWSQPLSLIEWSTRDVCAWLINSVPFHQGSGREYAHDFDHHQIDGLSLLGITQSHPALARMRLADYTLFESERRKLVTAEAAAPPTAPPAAPSAIHFSATAGSAGATALLRAFTGSDSAAVGIGAVRCGSDPTALLRHLNSQSSLKSRHLDISSGVNSEALSGGNTPSGPSSRSSQPSPSAWSSASSYTSSFPASASVSSSFTTSAAFIQRTSSVNSVCSLPPFSSSSSASLSSSRHPSLSSSAHPFPLSSNHQNHPLSSSSSLHHRPNHPFRHRRTSSIGASIVSDLLQQKRKNLAGGSADGPAAAVHSPAARLDRQGSGVVGAVGGWFAGWGQRQEEQQEVAEDSGKHRAEEGGDRLRERGEEQEGEEGSVEEDEEGEVIEVVVGEVVCLRGEVTAAEERECTVKAQLSHLDDLLKESLLVEYLPSRTKWASTPHLLPAPASSNNNSDSSSSEEDDEWVPRFIAITPTSIACYLHATDLHPQITLPVASIASAGTLTLSSVAKHASATAATATPATAAPAASTSCPAEQWFAFHITTSYGLTLECATRSCAKLQLWLATVHEAIGNAGTNTTTAGSTIPLPPPHLTCS